MKKITPGKTFLLHGGIPGYTEKRSRQPKSEITSKTEVFICFLSYLYMFESICRCLFIEMLVRDNR